MNKKNKTLILILVITLLIVAIGATFAYFQAQVGSGTSANVMVTTKTTDLLTFSKGNDITINANQSNFYNGAGNLVGTTTATASLRANNDTNSATQTYNVYFNITGNDFEYTTAPTNTPELLLTITDPSGAPVTSLTGLTYTTVGTVSGFDITTKSGLIQIASDYTITSNSSSTATTQTWNITVTLINLDSDQEANTDKTFTAQAIIQKEVYTPSASTFTGTIYRYSTEYTSPGYSIVPVTATKYEITDGETFASSFGVGPFDDLPSCETAKVDLNATVELYCDARTGTFGGLSDYETDSDNITSDIYLKHTVVNDIVTSSEACLRYNNHEFCLGPNYWVNGDSDGSLTGAKLQTAMETALGTSADNCSFNNGYVSCSFGLHSCRALNDGGIYCQGYGSNTRPPSCNVSLGQPSYCYVV